MGLLVCLLAFVTALKVAAQQNLTCHVLTTVSGPGAGPWINLDCVPSAPCNFTDLLPNNTGCAIAPTHSVAPGGLTGINLGAGDLLMCDSTEYITGGGSGGQFTYRCFCTPDTSDCPSASEHLEDSTFNYAGSPSSEVPFQDGTIIWTWTSQAPNHTFTTSAASASQTSLVPSLTGTSATPMSTGTTSSSGAPHGLGIVTSVMVGMIVTLAISAPDLFY